MENTQTVSLSGSGRGCVLVVEDDRTLAAGLRQLLESVGHSVLSCARVSTAQKTLRDRHIDLVISDFNLEDGSAEDLITWMSAQEASPPVLLVSAACELPGSVTQAPIVRGVLRKPAAPETVLGLVEDLLSGNLVRAAFPRLVGAAERSLLLEE
ncbi:MAG: hypothetical protein A3K19_19475 [Lentisphaerae bacterium RIFOXYB12_FULL_65_16]|nr:MAG: hypothetical protein A3K18_31340 [Lentisphaerae bacterium RIFOXYA12_64_32]OGV92043.1 MAG: hypothetical protein A3K19_19475 [Lentisphaerae bacterium RIFOXYB12_FULL_65_16]